MIYYPGPFEDNPIDPNDPNKIDALDNGALAKVGIVDWFLSLTQIVLNESEPLSSVETSVPSNDTSGANDNANNLTIDFGFVLPCQGIDMHSKRKYQSGSKLSALLIKQRSFKGKFQLPDKFYDITIMDASGKALPTIALVGIPGLSYDL